MELTPEERRRIYEEEAAKRGEDKPVLVERTGKKIKVWYIIGWLLVIGGASRSCGEISPTGNLRSVQWGIGVVMIGIVILIGAKLEQWWKHG